MQVVDRSAVIGSRPWQSCVSGLPVPGVAVLAEIERIELIECLASVDAELAECLVEGPLRAFSTQRGELMVLTGISSGG